MQVQFLDGLPLGLRNICWRVYFAKYIQIGDINSTVLLKKIKKQIFALFQNIGTGAL